MRLLFPGGALLLPTSAWAADVPVPAGSDLAAAVAAAADGDRLLLAAGDHDATGVVLDGRTLELVGEGSGSTRVMGGGSRVLEVGAGAIAITALTVDGEGVRGGIGVQGGSLTATLSTVRAGMAFEGGAVFADEGLVTLIDCMFLDNLANGGTRRGGGVYAEDGSLTIVGGAFTGNRAEGGNGIGGAVHVRGQDGTLDAQGVVFRGNDAERGGAVACDGAARCALDGVMFQDNTAREGGAARVLDTLELRIDGSTFCRNIADVQGGGLSVRGGASAVGSSWFLDNAASSGGGIWADGSDLDVRQVSLIDNTAPVGPALATTAGSLELVNTAVIGSAGPDVAVRTDLASAVVRHVLWFENGLDGAPLGTPHLLADPLDTAGPDPCDPAQRVRAPDSPTIDAGDPSVLDPDGSPSDIGAWPPATVPPPIDADQDGSPAGEDCDDADPDVSALVVTCLDADVDGHGDPSSQAARCVPAQNPLPCDDCDDTDPRTHPGALDGEDGTDRDCSGTVATIRYGTSCSEARGCSGGAAWMMVLPISLLARRRR